MPNIVSLYAFKHPESVICSTGNTGAEWSVIQVRSVPLAGQYNPSKYWGVPFPLENEPLKEPCSVHGLYIVNFFYMGVGVDGLGFWLDVLGFVSRMKVFGARVWPFGLRIWGLGMGFEFWVGRFRVLGWRFTVGFMVEGCGLKLSGFGDVWGVGSRVQDLGSTLRLLDTSRTPKP